MPAKIIRDKSLDLIKTGEIFTPLTLVDEIMGKLPDECWLPNKTYIDPACGDGNFLVRVVAWKIWLSSTAKQAVETTYGIELMEDNVRVCRTRLLINAFAAEQNKKISTELMPHLTYDDEAAIGATSACRKFVEAYISVATKNIVCHNALTYCYRFGNAEDEPRPESIGKCECPLCKS